MCPKTASAVRVWLRPGPGSESFAAGFWLGVYSTEPEGVRAAAAAAAAVTVTATVGAAPSDPERPPPGLPGRDGRGDLSLSDEPEAP